MAAPALAHLNPVLIDNVSHGQNQGLPRHHFLDSRDVETYDLFGLLF